MYIYIYYQISFKRYICDNNNKNNNDSSNNKNSNTDNNNNNNSNDDRIRMITITKVLIIMIITIILIVMMINMCDIRCIIYIYILLYLCVFNYQYPCCKGKMVPIVHGHNSKCFCPCCGIYPNSMYLRGQHVEASRTQFHQPYDSSTILEGLTYVGLELGDVSVWQPYVYTPIIY